MTQVEFHTLVKALLPSAPLFEPFTTKVALLKSASREVPKSWHQKVGRDHLHSINFPTLLTIMLQQQICGDYA